MPIKQRTKPAHETDTFYTFFGNAFFLGIKSPTNRNKFGIDGGLESTKPVRLSIRLPFW